ncbi:S9 family peptidase [Labrys monachus]|uniref:Oligopeptidase B n=1 Tax=Labrys monachus TaxID=217067 RepID=A0ABU0FJ63_9HYPH|nr:S9 family peptidase [Labrys monachus]MDQ0394566.1 oligopeptidase B [Labrys monachus]
MPFPTSLPAPLAEKRPTRRVVHGIALEDDYAWLRADNWQEVLRDGTTLPDDIRKHLEAENRYAEAMLAPGAALRAALFEELKGRIKADDASVPAPDGPYDYYSRFRAGGQHRIHCRRPRGGGDDAEVVLLDGDALAEGKSFFSLGGLAPSPDHRLIAWSSDDTGSEFYRARVLDTQTGENLADDVPDTGGGVVWRTDGAAFLYVRVDANHRPSSVWEHRLGTSAGEDRLVYDEPDAGMFVGLSQTQSRRFAVISVHDHETSEARLIDLASPGGEPLLIEPREQGIEYEVEHRPGPGGEDRLFILTNADGAEDFKIVTAPLASPGRAGWKDLIVHKPGRLVLSMAVFSAWLVRLEREEGLPRIVIRALGDDAEHAIAFDEAAYALALDAGAEFDTDMIRFVYSSMTTPAETWDYDMATQTRTLRKRQDVPSGHDRSLYVTRRVFAPAADGETVPVTLLHRRTTPLDGSAPLLLYGYGAYGISMPAQFSTNALSLVDRGFVYAIAHIRGGTEKGRRWYREGKLALKPNSFRDFIAAGEFLAREKVTARGRIVAHGGSAGGMLMGAVANMAPDLFGAIVAEVPFVDVLVTMLDDTLPLTPPEWQEWGNPIEDEAAFRTILSYSPIENVAARTYPPMLVLAGLSDPRVTYWEPAKWVARLREKKAGDNPVIFRINMESGHGGASGRFERLREVALVQAFALQAVDAA